MGVSKLPKVKELSEEYAAVLEQKKSLYAQYRLSREEMREYQKALHNTEVFFDMDRNSEIDYHLKEEFTKAQTQKWVIMQYSKAVKGIDLFDVIWYNQFDSTNFGSSLFYE